ncbi:MAG: pyridoxal 5'-phosphate synthase [Gammaproteobacteria bacterium]
MTELRNLRDEPPFLLFKEKYEAALSSKQDAIEAIAISSYNKDKGELSSRYVNLKYVIDNEFIFFTNYSSPKSIAFNSNDRIAALIYWSSINTQIRINASIKRTSSKFNKEYFKQRSAEKNALAISSNQSQKIESFDQIIAKYNEVKEKENLSECPSHWGGYSFVPFEIEFWEGGEHRLNRRNSYRKNSHTWEHSVLEP